jgi:hypothetical protein
MKILGNKTLKAHNLILLVRVNVLSNLPKTPNRGNSDLRALWVASKVAEKVEESGKALGNFVHQAIHDREKDVNPDLTVGSSAGDTCSLNPRDKFRPGDLFATSLKFVLGNCGDNASNVVANN